MITRSVDAQAGIIFVQSTGTMTREDIDQHYTLLREIIFDMRRARRPIRVLSDQTQAALLDFGLGLHVKLQIDRTYRAGDRVALLMESAPGQAYARGILGTAHYAVFCSGEAAIAWLMEPSSLPPRG